MKWSISVKLLLCFVLFASTTGIGLGSSGGQVAEAATDNYRFDFGSGGVENGYTGRVRRRCLYAYERLWLQHTCTI